VVTREVIVSSNTSFSEPGTVIIFRANITGEYGKFVVQDGSCVIFDDTTLRIGHFFFRLSLLFFSLEITEASFKEDRSIVLVSGSCIQGDYRIEVEEDEECTDFVAEERDEGYSRIEIFVSAVDTCDSLSSWKLILIVVSVVIFVIVIVSILFIFYRRRGKNQLENSEIIETKVYRE